MLASARFSAIVLIACSQSALSAEINWPEIAEQSAAMAWNCIKKRSDAALQVEASLGEMAQVVEALCKRELSLLNDGIYQASIADGKSQEQATKAAAEAGDNRTRRRPRERWGPPARDHPPASLLKAISKVAVKPLRPLIPRVSAILITYPLFHNPITALACPCLPRALTIAEVGDDAERVGSNAGQAVRDAVDRLHGGDRSGAGLRPTR
jgi:hypothetical protein